VPLDEPFGLAPEGAHRRRAASDAAARRTLLQGEAGARDDAGLDGAEPMWRYLWDAGIAATAADTPTVEAWPTFPWTPALHLAIARLGLRLGEFFDLVALAAERAPARRAQRPHRGAAKPLRARRTRPLRIGDHPPRSRTQPPRHADELTRRARRPRIITAAGTPAPAAAPRNPP
jgi:hypothetical protein